MAHALQKAGYKFVLIKNNYILTLFKITLSIVLITFAYKANAQCPISPVNLLADDTISGSVNSIANGATLNCGSVPFYIYADKTQLGGANMPCISSQYNIGILDGSFCANASEIFYEGSTDVLCIGTSTTCVYPIGDYGPCAGTSWGLNKIFLDPSQQHSFQFCYSGLLGGTTVQLEDCWSGNPLSPVNTFSLLSVGTHCFTDTVPAHSDIGTASFSITPASYSLALTDYHNGKCLINPALLAAGNYTVTYTFTPPIADGCSTVTGTFNFSIAPGFTVAVNSATVCAGSSATLTASGATTYSWSPSTGLSTTTGSVVAATPSVTNIYTVTGTHAGCSASATSTVTVNATPTVTVNSASICRGATATLTATGATTYSWTPSTGLSSTSISAVIANPTVTTTYTVIGTSGGCSSFATSTITVNSSPTVTVNSATICAGGTATLTASGAITYSWTPATGLSTTTGSTVVANSTVSTTYTIMGISGVCSSSAISTITVNPTPTVTVNSPAICIGATATLTASGANTYTWNTSTTGPTINPSPIVTTNYTVAGTDVNNCKNTATSTITVNSLPNVSVNSSTICIGATATLTANGANTYTWNTSAIGPTINPSPTITTNYTVTGTDLNNCTNKATSTITVNSLPTVTVNSATICTGNMTTLTASGANTYTWNTSATGATISPSPTVTTNYTVTGTGANSCKNIATSTVTVNPSITVTVNSATICTGATTTLTANGATTYSWTPSVGIPASNTVTANPLTTTIYTVTGTTGVCSATATSTVTVNPLPSISVNSSTICIGTTTTLTASGANTYTWNTSATGVTITASPVVTTNYTVSGTDIHNCKNTATSTITVNSLPTISINTTAICKGATATVTASGANTYTWNTSAISPTITPSPTVTTIYTVTGTDANHCVNTATSTVIVNPLPVVTVNNTTICEGANATLIANGATTYTWNTSATGATISPSPTVTTNYTVTGTDANGCINEAVAIVDVNPTPTVTAIGSSSVCMGQTISLSSNTVSGAVYQWSGPNGFASSSQTCTVTSATELNQGTYTLSIILSGCSATNTISVQVDSLPTIAHAGMDTTIYNSSTSLSGNVPLIGTGIWSVISGSGAFVNGNSANAQINNLQTGQNILQWTISNGACPASFDSVIVTVEALIIPNGFSPNGDGTNDYFEIKGLEEYSNVKLNVFNRWGNEVYESTNYKNDWNGKNMSGENLSDDTYFYTLEIPNKNTFKGYVILKRK